MAKPGSKSDKYGEMKRQEPPLCKCGCGNKTSWCKTYKRFNKFVNGHNSNLVAKDAAHLIKKVNQ